MWHVVFIQQMFDKANYSDKTTHKQAHDDFVATLGKVATPVGADTIHFAKDWSVPLHFIFIKIVHRNRPMFDFHGFVLSQLKIFHA